MDRYAALPLLQETRQVPGSIDERISQFAPVMYIFLALPVIVVLVLVFRRIYLNTVVKRQRTSVVQENRMSAQDYENAGEYVSAAKIYEEEFGDLAKAAELYEKGGDLLKAAELFEGLRQKKKARELYIQAGDDLRAAGLSRELGLFEDAALFYTKAGKHLKAASCMEKAGRKMAAARSYREGGDYRKAAELLYELGMKKEAAEMTGIYLRQKEIPKHLESYYSYASLLEETGETGKAKEIFTAIYAADPGFRDVAGKIKSPGPGGPAVTGTSGSQEPTEPPGPAEAAPPEMDALIERHAYQQARTLRDELRAAGRFEPRYALKLWVQALKALKEYVREKGPHGKICPECLCIDENAGLTLVEAAAELKDAPGPDIEGLGMVLYEMLTGRLPEAVPPGKKPSELFPDVPSWLDDIVIKCLSPAPGGGYGQVDEIFADLKKASQNK